MIYTQEQINEAVFIHVLHNQEKLKQLVNQLTEQKKQLLETEPIEFKDVILKEYYDLVRYEIQLDIAKALGLPADAIKESVSSINLDELLR